MNKHQAFEELLSRYTAEGTLGCERGWPLRRCCTFKIGGCADYAVYPKNTETLIGIVGFLRESRIKYIVLGNASNILFDDEGYRGAVIFTSRMKAVRSEGSMIYAECGASLSQLALVAQKNGLSGLEFAYGIPGTCGGAVCMNAGAFDGDVGGVLFQSTFYIPETSSSAVLDNAGHKFGYRTSFYSDRDYVILDTLFRLSPGDRETVRAKMDKNMKARVDTQPLDYPSAGSVFKRCPGHYTSKLIEEAGLKGTRIGNAQVSEKHAGFIINLGGATSSDVLSLIELIKNRIYELYRLEIECEIKHVKA